MSDKWFGPVKRWKVGNVLYAQNDFCKLAYVITDDPLKVGTLGRSDETENAVIVQFISAEQGKLWDDKI
jgi:hypothetical protein